MAATLLIISAFLHALWNALAKADNKTDDNIKVILTVATLLGLVPLPFIPDPLFSGSESLMWTAGAGVFETLYLYALAAALHEKALGPVYAVMRGGAMVFVWLVSSLFLGELLTPLGLAGSVGVFAGLYLCSRVANGSVRQVSRWAWFAAVSIAGYHLCYGRALELGTHPAFLFVAPTLISTPLYVMKDGWHGWTLTQQRLRERPILLASAGLFCFLSFFIFLYGLRTCAPGFAITMRNTSIVFAQFFSLAAGDRLTRLQWVGAILVAIGATALAWPT